MEEMHVARYSYANRFSAKQVYDPSQARRPMLGPAVRFCRFVWHGIDEEGYCAYRQDPVSGEMARIDFIPPPDRLPIVGRKRL